MGAVMATQLAPRFLVALGFVLPACLPDADYKQRGPTEPEQLNDGWEISTPEAEGLDPEVLARIHDELLREDRSFGTLGMLVIKNGKLVWETYLRRQSDRDHIHHIQSVTKSVTSLAFGLARDEGLFSDLDARLGDLMPDKLSGLDRRKRDITLEHLLTMRSGIDFDNDVFSVEILVDKPRDPLRYILEKPLYANPGQAYRYRDADPQLIAYLIERESGRHESDLVAERIFQPLGIRDYYWEHGPDGATQGAHALHLRPRDLAKIGQLMLDGCRWQDEQIVSAEWCTLATRAHIAPEQTGHVQEPFGFGYYFWVLTERGAFASWGHGGQFLLVVPDQDLLMVQVARPDSDDLHGSELEDFVELTSPLWIGE
jgi:CubicO group peptidase (beta-lactamase class C family)